PARRAAPGGGSAPGGRAPAAGRRARPPNPGRWPGAGERRSLGLRRPGAAPAARFYRLAREEQTTALARVRRALIELAVCALAAGLRIRCLAGVRHVFQRLGSGII